MSETYSPGAVVPPDRLSIFRPQPGICKALGLSILVVYEESFNLQILLNPFEEQLNLPASFINVGNSAHGQCKVVSQEYVMDARIGVFVTNTTQPDGAPFALAPVSSMVWSLVRPLVLSTARRPMTRYRAFVFNRVTKEMPLLFS